MANKAQEKAISKNIIVALVILVFLAITAGLGIWYAVETNGFTCFEYLTYNGEKLNGTARQVSLYKGENVFEIKNLNPFRESEVKYTLEIHPNADESFNFYVDGEAYSYSNIGELTDCFTIEKGEKSFSIFLPLDYSMEWLLSQIYEGEISAPAKEELSGKDLFVLTIRFANGHDTFVYFNIAGKVTDVVLDPPQIVF